MYAVYYWPFSSAAAPTPPVVAAKGWIGRPRRIPVERLREILKAQGSPWANELADTYQVAEKRLASPKISKKHAEVLEKIVETVSQRAPEPVDWGPIIRSVRLANEAARTTAAIKHAEAALRALQDEEDDDEEAIVLMMMDWR